MRILVVLYQVDEVFCIHVTKGTYMIERLGKLIKSRFLLNLPEAIVFCESCHFLC